MARDPVDLPGGVELYTFGAGGEVVVHDERGATPLGPGPDLLPFIDDGQFARYFIGDAKTSPQRPRNATYKLGMVAPRSAFTPHAHAGEHFVCRWGTRPAASTPAAGSPRCGSRRARWSASRR
jgi:hypothetical protein